MVDLVFDARFPGAISFDARYPAALTFDAVVRTGGAPPGDGWALDFSNTTYSGLAALIFEESGGAAFAFALDFTAPENSGYAALTF